MTFVRRAMVLAPALALALLTGAAGVGAGTIDSAACKRDLVAASAGMSESSARLKGGAKAREQDKCIAYRQQFLAAVKARAIFASCKTGSDRDTEVDRLDDTIENLNGAIAESCVVQ